MKSSAELTQWDTPFFLFVSPIVERALFGWLLLLDQDEDDDDVDQAGILNYALGSEDTDRVQFLVGSQSLKQNESQVTLVTLVESNSVHPTHLIKQTFAHPDGEVVGLTALPAQPDWFVTTFSHYSADRPDLRTGARLWRLPSLLNGAIAAKQSVNWACPRPRSDDHDIAQSLTRWDYVTTIASGRICAYSKVRCGVCFSGIFSSVPHSHEAP
ncbi:Protein tssc1 [Fasciola gigantica]|uniref:Protein tssc1 n=1 Tax=Fasciola gigantica TaxID=46835 RepID=A0A504Y9K0_FASGI|nr:Protein tssc1 [Fasciola gigantica]